MSSRSVTPARRSYSEVADIDETSDSVRPTSSTQSRGSKRARLDDEENDGDDDDDDNNRDPVPEAPEQPLLPESYRRSPNGKARANTPQDFQPGSIVRITLKNFVTYTEAEFLPGPNLNMVIGPNGTGKSTLVCAICLGLGWNTSHLGRAKDIGEFVKHGARTASIEIELARDPARHRRNQVIGCKIVKEGNKTKFSINGSTTSKREVLDLAQSFSIQVDNLCQFLPQDRVVEFAALSPVELLAHTQRAAAPEQMSEWHEQLKTMRKTQKQQQDAQESLNEQVKNLQDRQRSQEGDVVRLRERAQLLEKVTILEKLRPYTQYNKLREEHHEIRERRKAAQRELRRLEERIGPNLAAVTEKKDYLQLIKKKVSSHHRLLEKTTAESSKKMKKFDEAKQRIQQCMDEIDNEKATGRQAKQAIPKHQQEIEKIEKAMEIPPPDFDAAEINELIRQKKSRIREIGNKINDIDVNTNTVMNQGRQKKLSIEQLENQRAGLQSQAGRQENKLGGISKDAATAWKWIQEHQESFSGRVYGPPMIECSVKDARHADYIETILQESDLVAFTVTCEEDFKMLQGQLYTEMRLNDINIRSSTQPLSQFKASLSADEMRALQLECWVLDLIEGPEAVLAMLCDNSRIHQAAFTSSEPSDRQHDAIVNSGLSQWVTPTVSCQVVRRREYGGQGSTRIRPIQKARLLTDAPVDLQVDSDLKRRIAETEDEITELQDQVREMRTEMRQLNEEKKQLQGDLKQINDDKAERQRQLSAFNALPTKLEGANAKLDDIREQIALSRRKILEFEDALDRHYLEKGQLAVDCARSTEILRGLHVQLFEAQIVEIEATSDLEQMEARHVEEQNLLKQHQREVDGARESEGRALERGRVLGRRLQELGPSLTEEESTVHEEIKQWMPDRMETEVQSLQAQLDMLHGGNEHLIREYEQRERKIEEKRNTLFELEATLENLGTEISHVRELWEPRLDELIQQISAAFADNFSRIQCVGEVAVHKDEDFDRWAIQIKVKFREQEQLSILDSHRQSGGERAVSTIFYLMALQSLARAPFRVVDEINQGMDPRNERLVHSRMVDIACAEQSCQYFLITPKLLSGLKYHPKMKVHCIASGEYMPDDHRELNFGVLAKRALAVRAAVAAL